MEFQENHHEYSLVFYAATNGLVEHVQTLPARMKMKVKGC